MVLSDKTILELLSAGSMSIIPLGEKSLQPASVDIRIGGSFAVPEYEEGRIFKLTEKIDYYKCDMDTLIIPPKTFALATTMEYIKLPSNITAFVEGRSSIGRVGLFVQNAGWVDPGFEGEITLELFNASDCTIQVEKGQRVAQLVFLKMDRDCMRPYRGKYQGQEGAVGSKAYLDEEYAKLPKRPQE